MPRKPELPRIGISRCLLGDEVRHDGGHKRDAFLVSTFGRYVEWVAVCPEVEVGMGTPREPIHLVAHDDGVAAGTHRVRLVGVTSGDDWTTRMSKFAASRVRALAGANLSGYVLKKDSPSCGLDGVRVRNGTRTVLTGRGIFAGTLVELCPNLPVEEEDRLSDPAARENFVERVFAYQRLRTFFGGRWTVDQLVRFHAMHRLQLLSHSRSGYAELGRLLVAALSRQKRDVAEKYQHGFMSTLAREATHERHADILMNAAGHLKRLLQDRDREELLTSIDDHRRRIVPLVVPVTLLRHHVHRHNIGFLKDQTYLETHPAELSLRNHV